MTSNQEQLFFSDAGYKFAGISSANLQSLRQELFSSFAITPTQVCEAASYSMAMVVRFALGLSAQDGRVTALAGDSLSGWIALATLRHLANAGADATAIIITPSANQSLEMQAQINALEKIPISIKSWSSSQDTTSNNAILAQSHNMLLGLYKHNYQYDELTGEIVEVINELSTPIHCVESPLGVDPDSGLSLGAPVFASSTLSLGAPLKGLFTGNEYAGRHYLCDLSIPSRLYKKFGANLAPLFSEQPVIKIKPLKEEDKDEAEKSPPQKGA